MKKWYKSKTLIFNLLILAIVFTSLVSDDVKKYLLGLTIPNILLRLKTKHGLIRKEKLPIFRKK